MDEEPNENIDLEDELDKILEEAENIDDGDLEGDDGEENVQEIDVSNFFNYQKAINSLIDYLNISIDDMIARNPRSDQLLFKHDDKKLILNAILESGFYSFCQYRLDQISKSGATDSKENFLQTMQALQGEMDLLAYLLVNSRLSHRSITFDLYLSLLKGGLFKEIMEIHEKIVDDMNKQKVQPNKSNLDNIKTDSKLYI